MLPATLWMPVRLAGIGRIAAVSAVGAGWLALVFLVFTDTLTI